jgi:hypothetical protein
MRTRIILIKRKESLTRPSNLMAMLQNALIAQEERIKGLEIVTLDAILITVLTNRDVVRWTEMVIVIYAVAPGTIILTLMITLNRVK